MTRYEERIFDGRSDYFARLGEAIKKLPAIQRDNAWADHFARVERGRRVQSRIRPRETPPAPKAQPTNIVPLRKRG